MLARNAQGLLVREGQRQLAKWTLQPLAEIVFEELTDKLGRPVQMDTLRLLQAYDAGGCARAAAGVVQALVIAKEVGVDAGTAMKLVGWQE